MEIFGWLVMVAIALVLTGWTMLWAAVASGFGPDWTDRVAVVVLLIVTSFAWYGAVVFAPFTVVAK